MKTHRKILAGLLALGLVLAPSFGFAQSAYRFWWQVVDEQGRPYAGQTARCSVYSVGTGTALAYHFSAQLGTAGSTMPLLSDASSQFHFWTSSTSDVQVACDTLSGGQASTRLRYSDHTIVVDRQGRRVVRFPFVTNTSLTNTNVFLPGGAVVRDVLIQLTEGVANSHLNVGLRYNHQVSTQATNVTQLVHVMSLQTGDLWLRPHAVILYGTGTVNPYVNQVHRGAALAIFHVIASNDVSMGGKVGHGFYFERPYLVPNEGVELAYMTSNAAVKGHVYVLYDKVHAASWSSYTY